MPVARIPPFSLFVAPASPSQLPVALLGKCLVLLEFPTSRRLTLTDFLLGNSLKETQSYYTLPGSQAFPLEPCYNLEFCTSLKPAVPGVSPWTMTAEASKCHVARP